VVWFGKSLVRFDSVLVAYWMVAGCWFDKGWFGLVKVGLGLAWSGLLSGWFGLTW
jgi:hypothetical protein